MYLGDPNAPGPFKRLTRAAGVTSPPSPQGNGTSTVPPHGAMTVARVAAAHTAPRQLSNATTERTMGRRAAQSTQHELSQPNGNRSLESRGAVLQHIAGSTFLSQVCATDFGLRFSALDLQAYRDRLLEQAGDPDDPLLMMAIEQLALCHFRLGKLQGQSACAQTTDAAVKLNAAAAKLMAEFRKLLLAVREYRAPSRPQQVTLVRQQNLAAGDQQVALVEAPIASP